MLKLLFFMQQQQLHRIRKRNIHRRRKLKRLMKNSDLSQRLPTHSSNHTFEASEEDLHYLLSKKPKFDQYERNFKLELDIKRAALLASPSVVALVSYSGEELLCQACGTIIEVEDDNMNVVITSAKLIRRPTDETVCDNSLADNLKVVVFACDEKSYKAQILAYDFHYNLAVLKFKSDISLSTIVVRAVDDCLSVSPFEEMSFQIRPHSVKLQPGDSVITVGRYFAKPYEMMAAPGCFSVVDSYTDCDCKELLHTTCIITSCGEGSALVNLSGEMIGIVFDEVSVKTACMPINIAHKWWDHYKIHRESRHPYFGFEASNLYVASLRFIDKVIRRFPSISKGVIVDKVILGSSADSAGLKREDIIVKCDEKDVGSFLELWKAMWEKVGESVELVVARFDSKSFLNLNMMVVEATPSNLNSWPQTQWI